MLHMDDSGNAFIFTKYLYNKGFRNVPTQINTFELIISTHTVFEFCSNGDSGDDDSVDQQTMQQLFH